jgi:hypothetical protein
MIPDRYRQKDAWPHLFVRTEEKQELPLQSSYLLIPGPKYATKHYCRECHKEWWEGKEPRPLEPCPARNDKKEIGRLLG